MDNKIQNNPVVENTMVDLDDFLSIGSNYFTCGYQPSTDIDAMYYNNIIAKAFELIGRLYTTKDNKQSNYKRGVAFIASETGVSKRHVKVLRKKYKAHFFNNSGYVFRTPYDISDILEKIIELLDRKGSDSEVESFLQKHKGELYRIVLIGRQYTAIEIAALNFEASTNVKRTYEKLSSNVSTIRE